MSPATFAQLNIAPLAKTGGSRMRPTIVMLAGVAALGIGSIANAGCSLSHDELASARASLSHAPYNCSCDGNHGRYVSCVARAVNDLVRNHGFPTNCKGAVTRCAARSTCGKKDGFVTCAVCSPGTCSSLGFCDDGTTACTD